TFWTSEICEQGVPRILNTEFGYNRSDLIFDIDSSGFTWITALQFTSITSGHQPVRVLNEGWQEYRTPQGRTFYYNSRTRDKSWKPPRRHHKHNNKSCCTQIASGGHFMNTRKNTTRCIHIARHPSEQFALLLATNPYNEIVYSSSTLQQRGAATQSFVK
ncbi:hypothetical protein L9F63_011890, partial [Diploptera punctata]